MSLDREATHYRALSSVAANVAAAAALAAEQDEHARRHRHSLERVPYSAVETRQLLEEEEDDVDEEGLARLADSFHSEGGLPGHRKKVSWSQERRAGSVSRSRQSTISPPNRMHTSLHMTVAPQVEDADALARGRPLSREESADDEPPLSASQRRSSRASRKGASIVFLGAWALFGVGAYMNGWQKVSPSTSLGRTGRVLSRADAVMPTFGEEMPVEFSGAQLLPLDLLVSPDFARGGGAAEYTTAGDPEYSTEFIIGRIAAWACTTLYPTSRLPQIWKNVSTRHCLCMSIGHS